MLKKLVCTIALTAGLIAPALAQQDKLSTHQIAENTIAAITEGYQSFTSEAELQTGFAAHLCAEPGDRNLSAARSQFDRLARAWSRIEMIRFGPVLADNRLERILFWPDRKSTGLKQVQAAVATNDETVTEAPTLAIKSVAMQGLGALEYVLFGTGADSLLTEEGAHRCAYARAISSRLASTGAEIVEDWQNPEGISGRMLNPVADNADYRSDTEVLQEIVGIWIHGAELMRDTRIKPFFDEAPEKSNYKQALFWRSGNTFKSLEANIDGMRYLFDVSGLADLLVESGTRADDAFLFELDNFARTIAEINAPIEEAVREDEPRSKLAYLLILTQSLQNIAAQQIATELGLSVGFSALDGD